MNTPAEESLPLDVFLQDDRTACETEDRPVETLTSDVKDCVQAHPSVATVKVFTRHSTDCPHYDDMYWRDCHCCKWIYTYHDGQDRRKSAKTRSWSKADRIRQEIEDSLDPVRAELKRLKEEQQAKRIRIPDAIRTFLSDAEARNLKPRTRQGYRLVCAKRLLPWSERAGLRYLHELTTPRLTMWRSTWTVAPSTRKMQQERAKTFFEFCFRQGWLERNPAFWLSRIKVEPVPTDYFTREEFERLIGATHLMEGAPQASNLFGEIPRDRNAVSAVRLRTILLLLRWSGLRIGDAVTLECSRLIGDSILLYQAKTGEPVYVPLPPEVAEALRRIPPGNTSNPRYFFWNGHCAADTAIHCWYHDFWRLFKIADIRNPDGTAKWCHTHMLRDTFAIELLLADVPLDQVSMLLGHSSIRTTERHYAPWVRARQLQLEKSVRKAHRIRGITKSTRKAVGGRSLKRSNRAYPERKAA